MNGEILVRRYSSNDLNDIKEILSDYPSPTGRVWSADLVEEMMFDALEEQPDGVFVAEVNGRVVGFTILMHKDWFNIAYLDYIQVSTDWIAKGVGHRLIERGIAWTEKKGARLIYTETGRDNERAVKFYQRHGFKITGEIPDYYQEGLDALILVRKL